MMKSWSNRIVAAVAVLATVILLWLCQGCAGTGFEVCYVHPKYGTVCVEIDGTRHFKATLTPAEKAEVESWIKSQEPATPRSP